MSAAPAGTSPPQTDLERRTMRKVTTRLVPFLIALYFVNYLDRTNVGFAGPNGMNKELGLSATMFGLASGLFFAGYLLLEVPSNLALHKVGARRWLARIIFTWGVLASLMAFVPNATWLLVVRFLLGVAEAGFFPGIILYLTYWFPKRLRARATALFLLAVPLSTVVGAPFSAWLIGLGDTHAAGLAGWRFMFFVEGLPAVLLGIICWFYLTDRPEQARWLAPEERDWLVAEMDAEHGRTAARYHYPLRRALVQPRIWALAFVYFGAAYGLYALSFFLPTIIAGFSETFDTTFTLMQIGLITAVPFAFGAVAMVLWSHHGDRTGERVWHVAIPLFIGGVTIPGALYLDSPFTTMAAITLCCMCICSALPTFWPLPTTFLSGAAAAGGIALINTIGNASGFVAPYITGWLKDLTGTQNAGMWVVGVVMVLAGFTVVALKAAPAPDDDSVAEHAEPEIDWHDEVRPA
ncbi:MFS transporter [Mobilicoccus pelagius]|uniref:Putative tartrate transporter n=1 Tax=Mobilicoccus pelagius NBRC 104925 TaxID=1089455 RepID=H5UVN6_9MICO|nr:MFS transporter [Mobilicoccus pelagius]GAB49794.1 putative major facilitator superfamily transporter [Mobilicoccus pelagius NBRC 104925]